jgi:hypothetical protein
MPLSTELTAKIIDKTNISALLAAVQSGATFTIAPVTTGYTRQFQHQDWIDFVDPVAAGGTNGVNGRMHGIEHDLDLISAAIGSLQSAITQVSQTPPAVGMVVAPGISNGAKIPVPSGFTVDQTRFFAFPKLFTQQITAVGQTVQFSVWAGTDGTVTASTNLTCTGVAIAKLGGW